MQLTYKHVAIAIANVILCICNDTTDTRFRTTHNPNDFTHTTPELQSHVYI